MEDLKMLVDIVIIVAIACIVYTAFKIASWALSLMSICIGSC